jgi:hypothetical protein
MLCASVVFVLSALVLKILITANVFLPLEFTPHSLETVSGSEGHWGNEDLQLLGSGSAYIGTSDDRHGWMTPTGDTKVIMGMLAPAWAPPTEGSKMKALRSERQGFLTVGLPRAGGGWEQRELRMLDYPHADLHPHGLYVSERETFRGLPLVYAVNHRADEAGAVITDEISVCAASVRDGTCRYLYGIMSPELVSLNDVVSLSESPGGGGTARGEIYATRWRKNQVGTLMNVLETYLQLPLASVVHCTYEVPSAESLAAGGAGRIVQAKCETAAAGIKMSNGISLGREAMDKGQGSGTVELCVRRAAAAARARPAVLTPSLGAGTSPPRCPRPCTSTPRATARSSSWRPSRSRSSRTTCPGPRPEGSLSRGTPRPSRSGTTPCELLREEEEEEVLLPLLPLLLASRSFTHFT